MLLNIPDVQAVSTEPSSWVYAIRFGPYVKIGTSRGLRERLRQLPGTMRQPPDVNRNDMEPLCAVEGGYDLEQLVHAVLSPHRVIGEWYNAQEWLIEALLAQNTDEQREQMFGLAVKPESPVKPAYVDF